MGPSGFIAVIALFLSLLAGTLLSLFGWLQLSKRIGKSSAYLAATVLSVLAFAGLWFTREVEAWPEALALTAFAGVGFGGLQLLPFAMLTDVIHAARGDQRDCAGAFTGLWTAVEKSGLALGPLVIALILQEGGFRSGFKVQGDAAMASIQYAVSLAPAVPILASLPALFTYSARSRATEQGEVRRTPNPPSAAAVS